MAFAADDDVVVDGDPEGLRHLDDVAGHLDVGRGGGGIPRGMVVDEDEALAESSSARLTTSRG